MSYENQDSESLSDIKMGHQYLINHGNWDLHVGMVEKIMWGRSEPRPAVKILLLSEHDHIPIYMFVYNHKGTLCIEFRELDKVRSEIPYGNIPAIPEGYIS